VKALLKILDRSNLPRSLVVGLFASLEERGVRFCHWKSNIRLQEALSGNDDIDLLVHRSDAAQFHKILLDHGFKLAHSRSGIGHPGVFHAFALDQESAELLHLHTFHQVVSGDSLVKNYRLKIENVLLERTRHIHNVPVPNAESELVLFALRVALKHASWPEAFMINRDFEPVVEEMNWLRSAVNFEEAAAICSRFFPAIGPVLFKEIVDTYCKREGLLRRVALGRRVAWHLRHLRRMSTLHAVLSRYFRLFMLMIGRIRRRKDKMLQTGGAIVALVGPKATGKSTLGAALAERLGKHLYVVRIHAGKPPATALTIFPRMLLPLARRMFRSERPSEYQKPARRNEKRYSLLYVVYMTMLAYERRRLLQRALRVATAGGLVVSDRYPSETVGAIDSSCFDADAVARCNSRIKAWLMKKERSLYAGLPKPDLVIRLQAPIALTIRRDATRKKPGGPDEQAVHDRWDLESRSESFGMDETVVRTDRSIDDTVRDVISAVWRNL
jgi:thymidylate kinase